MPSQPLCVALELRTEAWKYGGYDYCQAIYSQAVVPGGGKYTTTTTVVSVVLAVEAIVYT